MGRHRLGRLVLAFAAMVAVAAAAWTPVRAEPGLTLLFVERSGCPWCLRFEREILPIYGRTPPGQRAPLSRFSLDDGQPKHVALDLPIRFTPTFVLVKDNREIGRITGYMNDAAFWGLLEKMLAERAGPG